MKKATAAILCGIFLLPFLYLPALSFSEEWRFPDLAPAGWTVRHWSDLGASLWQEAAISLLIGLFVAVLSTVTGFLTARQLSGHPARQRWLTLAYIPYAFSPVVFAWCLKYFFNAADLSGSLTGVMLAQFILTYPFAFLLFFNHFDLRMRAMEHLIYTLGGTPRQALLKVIVPVSKRVILLGFVQVFLISWFEYGLTSVIGLGQVRTLTVAVYQYIGESNPFVAASASCLICLPPLLLLWWSIRLTRIL
jgi:putative spermidine/putrescine transport system permease protein